MDLKECEVCGDKRDVSRHYGVACCYGCKAFFRRTVFEKKKYHCKEEKSCEVTKERRNRCRYCRYQKCLKAGMDEDNCREPYSAAKLNASDNLPSLYNPLESKASKKTLSLETEALIAFLKSMTKSTLDNIDPLYENITLDESLKLPINRDLSLADALQNPHLVVPKIKFDFKYLNYADTAFGWYQIFVYVAEWARGIPQFRMLKPADQERLFHLNFACLSIPLWFYLTPDPQELKEFMSSPLFFTSSKHISTKELNAMTKTLAEMYEIHFLDVYTKLKPDEEEIALIMAIMLFGFSESLSNEGHLICSKYKEKLYNALYEYQMMKFADKTELERIQRYTLLMELMHRVTKIWAEECEFHLLLSTFNEMNVDGLLKQLLFTKTLNT